ncbi:MAG: ribosome small subunit-dependent GTPase A [Planctomycetota bacterium]
MQSKSTGIVLRIDAKICQVEVDGQRVQVPLRGRLFEDRGRERNPVAVGDRVTLGTAADGLAIEEVLPRSTRLARRAKGEEDREQVIAANVSLVLVVSALREPPIQTLLIDRILAACARQDLRAELVLTKLDRDRGGEAERWAELYRGIGYAVHLTSVAPGHETHAEIDALAELMHANTTVLTGLSGAGKSSLLNVIVPGLGLRVGDVNRVRHGRHTTTAAELFPLPGGGYVLDTPGIRNFVLFAVAPAELTFWFREFTDFARQCAFRDCSHLGERDCGVRRAVESGAISTSRYESYRHLWEELRETERREQRGEV